MSIQGHVDAIKRHMKRAEEAADRRDKERELKFARVALDYLRAECKKLSDKQIMRESAEGFRFFRDGVEGL